MDVSACVKEAEDSCTDKTAPTHLKIGAIAAILLACVVGVCMPLVGRYVSALRADGNLFFVVKSFAAGVILATAYVHMLPDSFEALGNPCLAKNPWHKFPFAGFVSMLATLLVLLLDFSATLFYENKLHHYAVIKSNGCQAVAAKEQELVNRADGSPPDECKQLPQYSHVHDATTELAGARRTCGNNADDLSTVSVPERAAEFHDHGGHSHAVMLSDDESTNLRHRVIAQVLELGIVAHSVIIGITLGTSESPCTIKPLMAALTFHQLFEGMALGSCIAQAGYKRRASALMAFFFSVTTPLGIAIGMGLASTYNENSPKALIVQGLFDSMSTGILLYMSLVDLIAADFLSKRLRSDYSLQLYAFTALFLGAGVMSAIAYWA